MKRTNILLTEEQHKILKRYAQKETKTMGELVRDAVDQVYQKQDEIERRKHVAIDAYQEGFISLGRLAEILGMDPVTTRNYLRQKKIREVSLATIKDRVSSAQTP